MQPGRVLVDDQMTPIRTLKLPTQVGGHAFGESFEL